MKIKRGRRVKESSKDNDKNREKRKSMEPDRQIDR